MIQYNPKAWFTFIFKFHKADTFRTLFPMIVAMSIYTGLVVWVEKSYHFFDEQHARNIPQMHALLGFAISMLLVFRTNTAYERWWEGRRLWGNLVNATRNLSVKIQTWVDPGAASHKLKIGSYLISFSKALHLHLRKQDLSLELFDLPATSSASTSKTGGHIPMHIVLLLTQSINELRKEGHINQEQFINLNTEMVQFLDICGACERIKNTPIPFSYSVFIKKFIFFYTMTLPLGFGLTMGYMAVPIVVFIFYVLASLELIAEEIEDPFSGDENDLPTEKLAQNIKAQVQEILH